MQKFKIAAITVIALSLSIAICPDRQFSLAQAKINNHTKASKQPHAKRLAVLGGFSDWVTSVAFSSDTKTLATGSYEIIKCWKTDSHELKTTLKFNSGYAKSLAFSPNGELLAVGSYQTVTFWETQTNRQRNVLEGHLGYVTGIAFSPSAKLVATSSEDETVRLWHIDGEVAAGPVIRGHSYPVLAVAFSPDGQFLATAAGDETRVTKPGEVRLWDATTGKEVRTFPEHKKAATGVAFSPDGEHLCSTSLDETVNIYEVSTGKALGFFGGHSRPTTCVALCGGGQTVITGSGGRARGKNEVKFWDRATGQQWATIDGHKGKVTSLALAPNTTMLATASYDQTVALWDIAPVLDFAAKETANSDSAQSGPKQLRAGIIGLDTSHVLHFTRILNDAKAKADVAGCRVVAAYPKGSPDIESSVSRVPDYTVKVKEMGVEIVDSIPTLLEKVDVVLLETNDGRPHLEQIIPVLKAGKPVFIDKPIAGSLTDAVAIFELARKYKVPVFSSSSLRFGKDSQAVRNGSIGKVSFCETHSPASLEKTHPDLFWYGIHGVESLFTVMGAGCQSVKRGKTDDGKIEVVGTWKGDRSGIFREGKGYGGTAKGVKGDAAVGSSDGYEPLLVEIVKFFRTGVAPVSEHETLEIYTFMEAADESKRRNGAAVDTESVLEKARAEAKRKLLQLDPPTK